MAKFDIEANVDKILSEREDCKLFVEAAVDNAVNTIGYRASCFLESLFNFTEKSHNISLNQFAFNPSFSATSVERSSSSFEIPSSCIVTP